MKANAGLSPEQKTRLLVNAVEAVRRRSLGILSGVTVAAVLERTLLECKEKHPVLASITGNVNELDFHSFGEQARAQKAEDVQRALEDWLLEILDVFGKITADILTKYLHQELMTVTCEPATKPPAPEPQASRTLSFAKKNRERK
ncbi:MAG: hypothetical protein V4760_11845 [Bdellovibrionota bacterium]